MAYIFAVDLGGTTVKMGLFETAGNLLEKWEIDTNKEDQGSHILPDIAASIRGKMTEKSIKDSDVAGVGIGVPGAVRDNGDILGAANLGWVHSM